MTAHSTLNIGSVDLTDAEKAMITHAVNTCVTDGAPLAYADTLPFFRIAFVIECLSRVNAANGRAIPENVDLRFKLHDASK